MAKAKKPVAAGPAPSVTLNSPSANNLEWTLPPIGSGKGLVYTYINWANEDHINIGGVQIYQFQKSPMIVKWTNHSSVGDKVIPPGVWSVRVTHYVATLDGNGGYNSSQVDNPYFSNWVTASFT